LTPYTPILTTHPLFNAYLPHKTVTR
jgi:hypothetical protein